MNESLEKRKDIFPFVIDRETKKMINKLFGEKKKQIKYIYVDEQKKTFQRVLVSISPTFYVRHFRTKVLHKAFLFLHFRFDLFWRKNIGANALRECW